jgi:hypothetical protein
MHSAKWSAWLLSFKPVALFFATPFKWAVTAASVLGVMKFFKAKQYFDDGKEIVKNVDEIVNDATKTVSKANEAVKNVDHLAKTCSNQYDKAVLDLEAALKAVIGNDK